MYIVKPFTYFFFMNYWMILKGFVKFSYKKYNFDELIELYKEYLSNKKIELDVVGAEEEYYDKLDEYMMVVDGVNISGGKINGMSYFEIERDYRVLNDIPINRNDILFIFFLFVVVFLLLSVILPLFKIVFFDDLLVHLSLMTSVSIIAAMLVEFVMGIIGVGDVHLRFFEQIRSKSCVISYLAFLFFKITRCLIKIIIYASFVIALFFSPILLPSQDDISVCLKNGDKVQKGSYEPIYNTSNLTLFKSPSEDVDIWSVFDIYNWSFEGVFVVNNSNIVGFGEDVSCSEIKEKKTEYLNVVEELSDCELDGKQVLFKAHIFFGRGEPLIRKAFDPKYNDNLKPENNRPWVASLNRGKDDNGKGKPELKQVKINIYTGSYVKKETIILQSEKLGEFKNNSSYQYYVDIFSALRDNLFKVINENVGIYNNMNLFVVSYTDHKGPSIKNLSLSDRRIHFAEYAFGINCFDSESQSCMKRGKLLNKVNYYPIPFSEISYLRLKNIADESDEVTNKLRVAKILLCK